MREHMKAKNIMVSILAVCLILSLSACGSNKISESESIAQAASDVVFKEEMEDSSPEIAESSGETEMLSEPGDIEDSEELSQTEADNVQDAEDEEMQLKIEESTVNVEWEDNASVDALAELASAEPVTVQMSMYGGFEQVGSLGTSLPRDDVQTTTSAGDIVLYSGNQVVVFYGSNSWAYTRLGKITGLSAGELKELLGNGDVTITIGK